MKDIQQWFHRTANEQAIKRNYARFEMLGVEYDEIMSYILKNGPLDDEVFNTLLTRLREINNERARILNENKIMYQ